MDEWVRGRDKGHNLCQDPRRLVAKKHSTRYWWPTPGGNQDYSQTDLSVYAPCPDLFWLLQNKRKGIKDGPWRDAGKCSSNQPLMKNPRWCIDENEGPSGSLVPDQPPTLCSHLHTNLLQHAPHRHRLRHRFWRAFLFFLHLTKP